MIAILERFIPLAVIGDNFPQSGPRLRWSDLWAYGIAAIVAAIATAIVLRVRRRNDMSISCDDPGKLFRELCQVHQLDGASQRLLRQLARFRQFQQPAQVFLSPEAYDSAGLPANWASWSDQLSALKQRLF